MKQAFRTLAVGLVGAGLVAFAAAPAVCSDEFCAMGGTLIKAEVVKDKAIEWGKDRRKAIVADEDADTWSVLTLSRTDDGIAIIVNAGGVYFGVAGRAGREVDERDAGKAFGKDFGTLADAVKKEMNDLWKSDVVKIDGADIQKLADALALGTLEKDRDWKLTTQNCKGYEVDTTELR
jgi:hypothetical protein